MTLLTTTDPVFSQDEPERITRAPFPNSKKIYVTGSQPSIRVPMREITQGPTKSGRGAVGAPAEHNPTITVYDTSGPYSDPDVAISVRKGLAPLRREWILGRGDVVEMDSISSEYGRRRESDPALTPIRFDRVRLPLRAAAGKRVTQMHYARRGEITPEMEFIAIRENMRLEQALEELRR